MALTQWRICVAKLCSRLLGNALPASPREVADAAGQETPARLGMLKANESRKGDGDMLPEIASQMPALEFGNRELDEPISLNEQGGIATVRELIADRAPASIREMFRINIRAGSHVRPIDQLDGNALKAVAVALLKVSDPRRRVASMGGGDFDTDQLMGEVERGTPMGQKIVRGVRLNGLLVESAVTSGKIRPRV